MRYRELAVWVLISFLTYGTQLVAFAIGYVVFHQWYWGMATLCAMNVINSIQFATATGEKQ